MLFGGDFQSGVYAKGGSLEAHGIKQGDTFLKTISGNIQKVKDKNGKIVYVDLSNGERDTQPPLPFNRGGSVTNERKHVNKDEDYEVRYSKSRPKRKGYKGLRSFDNGGVVDTDIPRYLYHATTSNNFKKIKENGLMLGFDNRIYFTKNYGQSVDIANQLHQAYKEKENKENIKFYHIWKIDTNKLPNAIFYKDEDYNDAVYIKKPIPKNTITYYQSTKVEYDEGGNIDLTDDKRLRVRKPVMPKRKLTEAEWMAKHNDSKEARTYGFGGLFSKSGMMSKPKPIDLNQQQVRLKSGEYVQVLSQQGDTLMVMDLTKLGTGTAPKYAKLSDVDMTSLANGGGVGLIGNQKRIDMNKNGKIDAEDFKLLRSSMNGAWRNERKHVNHNEDYEVRYAKKKPARTGYKGKRKFGEGGGISNFERLSRVVAKNYEGKRVKPQYQKEYGKVYSKAEAKEVGNKVAGKMKMMKKAESGTAVPKGNRGGVMVLAKKIRKEGESWKDALKRAGQQLK